MIFTLLSVMKGRIGDDVKGTLCGFRSWGRMSVLGCCKMGRLAVLCFFILKSCARYHMLRRNHLILSALETYRAETHMLCSLILYSNAKSILKTQN